MTDLNLDLHDKESCAGTHAEMPGYEPDEVACEEPPAEDCTQVPEEPVLLFVPFRVVPLWPPWLLPWLLL